MKRINVAATAGVALLFGATAVLLVYLSGAFGGPSVSLSKQFELTARITDSQHLLTASRVLVRGVEVGRVSTVRVERNGVRFSFTLDGDALPVYRDATVAIGHRTLFGEAYVDLDVGTPRAGTLSSGAVLPATGARETVELDEALEALDAPARRHVRGLARTAAQVAAHAQASTELNATFAGLARTLSGLRRTTATLHGQEDELTHFVGSGREVLTTLADDETAIRTLVTSARQVFGALNDSPGAVRATIHAVSDLEHEGRLTLDRVRPLLRTADPVLTDLAAAAPDVTAALRDVPSVARAAFRAVRALPAFDRALRPTAARLRRVAPLLRSALAAARPVLRNLVPALEYLRPYASSVVAWAGNTAATTRDFVNGQWTDRPMHSHTQNYVGPNHTYLRFSVNLIPATLVGAPDNKLSVGAYPKPGPENDLTNQDGYPRLQSLPPSGK